MSFDDFRQLRIQLGLDARILTITVLLQNLVQATGIEPAFTTPLTLKSLEGFHGYACILKLVAET